MTSNRRIANGVVLNCLPSLQKNIGKDRLRLKQIVIPKTGFPKYLKLWQQNSGTIFSHLQGKGMQYFETLQGKRQHSKSYIALMLKTVAHLKYLLIHDLYLGENKALTTRICSIITLKNQRYLSDKIYVLKHLITRVNLIDFFLHIVLKR